MLCAPQGPIIEGITKCEPCPSNPELIVVGLILALVIIVITMRELDKRKFNLAFVSIGWDYFQVLALFSDADICWPPLIKQLFRLLSFFNFDIDVAAPECLVPDFPYRYKLYITLAMPGAVAVGLFCMYIMQVVWHKFCLRRSGMIGKTEAQSSSAFARKLLSISAHTALLKC